MSSEPEPNLHGRIRKATVERSVAVSGLSACFPTIGVQTPPTSLGIPTQQRHQANAEQRGHAGPLVAVQFYGIVKSYNPEKGFGFIVCDALKNQHDGDVYLHSRHIGDFKVGQEVKFQAYLHNGRLQGRELQDATGMVGPQTGFAPLPTGGEEQELGVFVGKIKNYNHEKGFGFIFCEALNLQGYQGDVFLHSKNKGTFEAGDEVAFMAVLRNGKLQAKDLQAASTVLGEMGLMGNTMMGGMANPMGGMVGDMDPAAKRARMY